MLNVNKYLVHYKWIFLSDFKVLVCVGAEICAALVMSLLDFLSK